VSSPNARFAATMRLTPRGAARRGARALRVLARGLDRLGNSHKVQLDGFMASWDMVAEPDEQFYLAQYWHWLEPVVARMPESPRILDVGCGQGRLAVPLAETLPRATVVGVDLSEQALTAAAGYIEARGIENVELRSADAIAFLSKEADSSAELVLFVEVTEWMEGYRKALAEIARVLKPGGTLFASLRTQYHQLLSEVKKKRLDAARTARDARSAHLGDTPVAFTWQTVEDVRTLLDELGFEIVGLYAIGVLSGTPADPLTSIARPAQLAEKERAQLLELELSLAEQYAGCGRYTAVIATRK
jgi:ubiquinone/menaquinone biosynthesis C-methylase UbiE